MHPLCLHIRDQVQNTTSYLWSKKSARSPLATQPELDIRPDLYELWLDSVCQTVKLLDPEWTQALQLAWRDQLRPGISFITSHY